MFIGQDSTLRSDSYICIYAYISSFDLDKIVPEGCGSTRLKIMPNNGKSIKRSLMMTKQVYHK